MSDPVKPPKKEKKKWVILAATVASAAAVGAVEAELLPEPVGRGLAALLELLRL